jgi:hypothetical protein
MLTEKQMSRAVQMLFESASCVGHQLFFYDQVSALLSALTLRQLRRVRGNDLTGVGDITGVEVEVCRALDRAMGRPSKGCEGLDRILDTLQKDAVMVLKGPSE